MIKRIILVFLLIISFSLPILASGFFNLGEYDRTPRFFFGAFYTYGWRDIYLGDQQNLLYSLKYVDYDAIIGAALTEDISIYGLLGMNDFQFEDNIDGKFDYKLGGGIRIKFLEFVKIALKAGESESKTFDLSVIGDFRISYYKSEGESVIDLTTHEIDWTEYQGTLAFMAKLDSVLFYLGGKCSFLEGNITPAFMNNTTFSNNGFLSLVIGGEVDIVERMRFGAEASVFEETYISTFLQFNF
jgi:hypothetical protein